MMEGSWLPASAVERAASDCAIARELLDHPEVRRLALQADNGNVLAIVENVERADRHQPVLEPASSTGSRA